MFIRISSYDRDYPHGVETGHKTNPLVKNHWIQINPLGPKCGVQGAHWLTYTKSFDIILFRQANVQVILVILGILAFEDHLSDIFRFATKTTTAIRMIIITTRAKIITPATRGGRTIVSGSGSEKVQTSPFSEIDLIEPSLSPTTSITASLVSKIGPTEMITSSLQRLYSKEQNLFFE